MPDGVPQIPDPTKLLNASVESVGDLLNTGVRGINTVGASIQNAGAKVVSAANLPVLPAGVPQIPEIPPITAGVQGLPGLPQMPFGLPAFPGMPGAGGGNGGGGQQTGEKKAAGTLGYGEPNGKTCIRAAGAGALGYGEP